MPHNLYYLPMDTMEQIDRFTDELRRQEKSPNTTHVDSARKGTHFPR
jgi:hypothetical protein